MPNEFAEAPADKNKIQIRFSVVGAQGKNFILPNVAENECNCRETPKMLKFW